MKPLIRDEELSRKRAIAGRAGGIARASKYPREQLVAWAKLGGGQRLPTASEIIQREQRKLLTKKGKLPKSLPKLVKLLKLGYKFKGRNVISFRPEGGRTW